jgi:alpha-1,2-mannosyltransferase
VKAPPLFGGPTWLALVVLALAGAVAAAFIGELKDLLVYQYGGRAVLADQSPYARDDPATGLPFTYPPFAAVLMVPLALLPTWLAAAVWTGASAVALGGSVVVVRRGLGRTSPAWLVVVLAVAALAVEPVWQNVTFGQINLLLMLAVLWDLLRPERRLSGVALGIAAGVKLTPLVFVVLLLLTGHRDAASRALLAFGATVAVGFALMPGSAAYWTDRLLDPSRVGPPALAHNQSVYGALTRALDSAPSTHLWLVAAAPVAVAVVLLAALWWRRGDRVLAICLAAMAMLVASPIAWSHHWVWVVPIALVLWERNRWAAAAWVAVFVARPIVWPPWGAGRELEWSVTDHLAGNAYLLAALVLAAWASRVARRPLLSCRHGETLDHGKALPGPRPRPRVHLRTGHRLPRGGRLRHRVRRGRCRPRPLSLHRGGRPLVDRPT